MESPFPPTQLSLKFRGLALAGVVAIYAVVLCDLMGRCPVAKPEAAILVSGIAHWNFGKFDFFCVNPPLVRLVAAVPVLAVGYQEDWKSYDDRPGARTEFVLGVDFAKANGERSVWLITIARWACLPFTLSGAIFSYCFARELWKSAWAGLAAMLLWCIEPNLLAHGALITNDVACASFGLGATWLFWRWLQRPTWSRAGLAGVMFGLAQLTKMSWLFLFGLWPLLWLFWLWSEHRPATATPDVAGQPDPGISWQRQLMQLAAMLCIGLYLINLGYAFDESFTRLKKFEFVSKLMTGHDNAGKVGNRFQDSWLGELPVPLPKQYLLGFDLQKKDFEHFPRKSYLRGEWKQGGWWYYYLYGLCVKVPHGIQLLWLAAIGLPVWDAWRRRSSLSTVLGASPCSTRDLIVMLAPGLCLFVLVSSQLEFNEHFRYVLPTIATLLVYTARLGRVFEKRAAA